MTVKDRENVLGVPTRVLHEAGLFQGFSPRVDHYLARLLNANNLSVRRRAEAETDPTFKQIIPYVILKWRDQLFHYARGKRATENAPLRPPFHRRGRPYQSAR